MQKLYSQCLETANIEKAIHTVYSHEGAKTAGADGISKSSNITQERIVKEVKLRLRRYKSVQSRKVHIPKGNGEFRELTIINLFDRIAQQAVYQIISPLLERKMSKHSYGFRKGIGAKVPVSRLADILLHQKETYTVELDFKKCFDNIPLDKAIGCLKEMGIKNFQLLRTIKHLMWTSKEYSGVGLSQGTFEINKRDTAYTQNHKLHKDDWIQWNLKRGKKICCRYYRYADDTLITCHNEAEQRFIADAISSFINQNLEIEINQVKSHYRHNEIHFLGFALIKNKRSIWILFDNPKEYTDRLKRFKLYTYTQCQAFMKWFRGILNYFDIVNDMGNFLDKVEQRLYRRIKRGVLSKFGNVYQYGEGREKIFIDIYSLRKTTKTSYKEYLIGSKWLDMRELLKYRDSEQAIYGAFQYLWSLWTKQKGKDAITKEDLDPLDAQIHHVKPFSKGGSNNLENLILVSSKTHYLIHHGKDLDKRFEKYRKHLK
ncbi:MAG: hypothetical protein J5626_11320 [Lachnospiraceae bacterium]|nr:hypothetical protein [Lachnospiraceae bacterium]